MSQPETPGAVRVLFKRLSPRATLPAYQTAQAAGMDLSACLPEGERVTLAPGQIAKIPLGFAVALPAGYEAQIRPRSGLATKFGVTVPNAPGTVDADYRGEMVVALINLGREPYIVEHGARVAQMVVAPVSHAQLVETDILPDSQRGAGGFGSTGGH
ncbi:MAG: dUTP diphosphatase [bacterium]|jgi:dUTP pyrophosphatase|nr:dUTP diphosphatase [Phycisphaerales bacterium]MCE2652391.1 dUTP diphosphatase [Planctomycetaceae bacterium]